MADVKVFRIEVAELGLVKRRIGGFDHKVLQEQIKSANYPKCSFFSFTNTPKEYDEEFTVEIIGYERLSGGNARVTARFVNGKNKGKVMEKVTFNKLVKGDFKKPLERVLNDTDKDIKKEKSKIGKMLEDLQEKLNIEKMFRERAEKNLKEVQQDLFEEREKRVKDSWDYEEQIHKEYKGRIDAEKEVEKQMHELIVLRAEVAQSRNNEDYYKKRASKDNVFAMLDLFEMGVSREDIANIFNLE